MVMNMNNNTLETHEKITLNKDDDIFFRRITNFSYVAMYFHYNTTC